MSLWLFYCEGCQSHREEFCDHADLDKQKCGECGDPLERVYTPAVLTGDLENTKTGMPVGYYDDTLEAYITSNSQKRELMKAKGLEIYESSTDGKKDRAEIRYAKEHSDNPAEVKAFAAKISKEAGDKRRKKAVKAVFDKATAEL